MLYTASVSYRNEKPFGVGRTAHERHSRVVGGYRAEVISGLEEGHFIYTGVCATRQAAVAELVSQLKTAGLSGKLRIV